MLTFVPISQQQRPSAGVDIWCDGFWLNDVFDLCARFDKSHLAARLQRFASQSVIKDKFLSLDFCCQLSIDFEKSGSSGHDRRCERLPRKQPEARNSLLESLATTTQQDDQTELLQW